MTWLLGYLGPIGKRGRLSLQRNPLCSAETTAGQSLPGCIHYPWGQHNPLPAPGTPGTGMRPQQQGGGREGAAEVEGGHGSANLNIPRCRPALGGLTGRGTLRPLLAPRGVARSSLTRCTQQRARTAPPDTFQPQSTKRPQPGSPDRPDLGTHRKWDHEAVVRVRQYATRTRSARTGRTGNGRHQSRDFTSRQAPSRMLGSV